MQQDDTTKYTQMLLIHKKFLDQFGPDKYIKVFFHTTTIPKEKLQALVIFLGCFERDDFLELDKKYKEFCSIYYQQLNKQNND